MHYPQGHGGLGLPRSLQTVADEEFAKAGAPPLDPARNVIGLGMAAPTIIAFGTEEQKHTWLKPLWTADEIWCQLFSEPGARSDLAGLATRAVRDGDDWIVNGQKVWTSLAHQARWGLLLARTDPDVPKHAGLSYFVADMHAPGVEVRPLRQLTGEAEFNEVFLTDVRIPDGARLGAVGEGWRVAQTTLMNERVSIGSARSVPREESTIGYAVAAWRQHPERRTHDLHQRLLRLWAEAEVARLAADRLRQQLAAGEPGPEGSAAKLTFARLNQEISGWEIEFDGVDGLRYDDWTMRRAGAATTAAAPGTATCGPRATRSRAAPPRSCATSSPSASSACRPSRASTPASPGRTCHADDCRRRSSLFRYRTGAGGCPGRLALRPCFDCRRARQD